MPSLESIISGESMEINVANKPPATSFRNTYLAAVPALIFSILMGFVGLYPAPATADMKQPGSRFRHITDDEISWIASLPLISGIFGNTFSGYATQNFGRKACILYLAIIYLTGWLSIAYAQSVAFIYLGRILSGFCATATMISVPSYLVEISPAEIRGRMTTLSNLANSLGSLIIMSVGMTVRWSWLAIVGATFVSVATILMTFVPESPPWLVKKSRMEEAVKGLQFLRGRNVDVTKELQDLAISEVTADGKKIKNFQLKEIFDRTFYKPCLISVALVFFHGFSGMSPLMVYTVSIFQKSGGSIQPNVASIIMAFVQFLGCLISSFLMDKAGRRLLYLTSGFFMTVSLVSVGTYTYIVSRNDDIDVHKYGWIPLACLVFCMLSFTTGLAVVPFVVIPEISPLRSRSVILGVATLGSSLFIFIVVKMYDVMQKVLGLYGLYWFYSLVTFTSMVFGYFVLPETKGLSLQEIQTMLSSKERTLK